MIELLVPQVPTEPSPMPDPCSGELDTIMLGEALSLQAIGKQSLQPADLETWINGNDMGSQHEQAGVSGHRNRHVAWRGRVQSQIKDGPGRHLPQLL